MLLCLSMRSAATRSPHVPVTTTHKVDSNCRDVAVSVGVVLRSRTIPCFKIEQHKLGTTDPRTASTSTPTANRSSRHDLPTPESPISRSCGSGWKVRGLVHARTWRAAVTHALARSSP